MRDWIKSRWTRFNAWVISILAAIGITIGTVMVASAMLVQFSWTLPTLNTDGSALDVSQIVESRLYCDIDPADFIPQTMTDPGSHAPDIVVTAPAETTPLELRFGRHDCFATVLAQYDDGAGTMAFVESDPSNVATKIVAPPKPQPPGLD